MFHKQTHNEPMTYISKNGTQYGPFSAKAVVDALEKGIFTLDDMFWNDESQQWTPLREIISHPMMCELCGTSVKVKKIGMDQLVGGLIYMFHTHIRGHFCKRCIHREFWKRTSITLFSGWWGISLFVAPLVILQNLFRYLFALPMPSSAVPPPVLTSRASSKMRPYTDSMIQQLISKRQREEIAYDLSRRSGVEPGQAMLFLHKISGQTLLNSLKI